MNKLERFFRNIQLKNRQRAVNKQYEKEGLTDDVLEKQVEINTLRNQLDIPDSDEFVYEDFVQ